MSAAVDSIREVAATALSEGTVGVFIGYGRDGDTGRATPVFARTPEDAADLIFDATCLGNLAVYLARPEVRSLGRPGVLVKGCDLRSVNVLFRENVIDREDVYLVGVRCPGVGEPAADKCGPCKVRDPAGCDVVVGDPVETDSAGAETKYEAAAAIEALSLEDRWAYWQEQFGKCIRCYACRQACPLCYCKRCIVEKSQPQWVETSPHVRGNLAWHAARAFHLTGRCVGCGECERACPVDIPLGAINQKLAKLVEEWFGFESGFQPDEEAPFTTWSADDPEVGIL